MREEMQLGIAGFLSKTKHIMRWRYLQVFFTCKQRIVSQPSSDHKNLSQDPPTPRPSAPETARERRPRPSRPAEVASIATGEAKAEAVRDEAQSAWCGFIGFCC